MKVAYRIASGSESGAALRIGAAALLGLLLLILALPAQAQQPPSAFKGGYRIYAGAAATGADIQYGQRKMLGLTGFVEADSPNHFGLVAEGRWLEFRQTANVHLETYSIGLRYHRSMGRRFLPYAKAMTGFGDFNFPFNMASGRYLVATFGGGVDYTINRKVQIRLADMEYQYWPDFTFGSMSSPGVSAGLRIRIF